ncbi:MAG TPA: Wzz/FepE/Etk N-terminal domain-containing protein [Hyphomicrobiales bacterium]|nr:Wzz/FepE/Etk N-terminal domain-containing protein [Hyphomicrobiales bacterium]
MSSLSPEPERGGEIDLGALGRALWRKRWRVVVPTVVVALLAIFIVARMTPEYRSEARVLIENSENVYTSPGIANPGVTRTDRAVDDQEMASQVQLVLSRDLAVKVIGKLKLGTLTEFDPLAHGMSLPTRILVLFGLRRDPRRMSAEERVLAHYYDNLDVFQVGHSNVISIDFESKDSELAARVANGIAEGFLALQQSAKQSSTRSASTWLGGEIDHLRARVADAEKKAADFRSKSDLFIGSNNAPLSQQQLGELNSELARARGDEAVAAAKATQIRAAVASGSLAESLDIANSELMRALVQQRALMGAAIARARLTYGPQHPELREMNAQLAGLDRQIRDEALKLAAAYEAEGKVAAGRVASLRKEIADQQVVAATAGQQDIELQALQRDAAAERNLLDQYLARYRDAVARESLAALPPDARVISQAVATSTPYFPKPVPIVVIATLAALMIAAGVVTAGELMRRAAPAAEEGEAVAEAPIATPLPVRERAASAVTVAASPAAETPAEPVKAPAADEIVAVPPVADTVAAFGRLHEPAAGRRSTPVDIEAADAAVVGQLAAKLAAAPKGEDAMDILLVGASGGADAGDVGLSLARALAEAGRKVVVVDAGGQSAVLAAAAPKDDHAGLGELLGGGASFGQTIHRDAGSAAHLVPHGSGEVLKATAWPRLETVLDALGLTYDFVLVVGPAVEGDAALARLAKRCRAAILVGVGSATAPATQAAYRRLVGEGLDDIVVLLTRPSGGDAAAPASA